MQGLLQKISERALSDAWTVSASYWTARQVIDHGIPGDFVECGVFAGVQCAAMAKACIDAGQRDRRIHMFDSFAGIPKAGPNDDALAELLGRGRIDESSGVSVCTEEQVMQHMGEWGIPPEMLVYHKGWFHETVPSFNQPIALLRLDGDLYESTKVCMRYLYPQLSRGGVCIIDDYSLDGCKKAVDEYFGGGVPGPVYWCKN